MTATLENPLLDLAAKIEAASGGDYWLDRAICEAACPERMIGFAPPAYTASVDAALSLVPEGYDYLIGKTNGGLTCHAEVGGRGDEFMRFGATPALALCAASLRALANQEKNGGDPV